jgi:hypothetical protein
MVRPRQRQAAETARLRRLLEEADLTLRRALMRRHTVPASGLEISVCHVCGGCDEHTPDCLLYRLARTLEEAQGMKNSSSSWSGFDDFMIYVIMLAFWVGVFVPLAELLLGTILLWPVVVIGVGVPVWGIVNTLIDIDRRQGEVAEQHRQRREQALAQRKRR